MFAGVFVSIGQLEVSTRSTTITPFESAAPSIFGSLTYSLEAMLLIPSF